MDILEEIKNRVSLLDVISKHVKLTKKGREYLGNCPFHQEKTPSFYVNPTKGFYYCFGCSAKGNIFNFIMETQNVDFKEAVIFLAQMGNIPLPQKFNLNHNPQNNLLQDAFIIASKYFKNNLLSNNPESKRAYEYLLSRGFSAEVINKFDLGYAFNNNPELFNQLEEANINDDIILEMGLKSISNNGSIYEFFKNRIIFPIKNIQGRVVAFGGRVIDDSKPKYLNSKESSIFSKKNTLFGLNLAMENMKKDNHLLVVEGYLDVISLHQYGFNTAVAALGTAINTGHLNLINKYDNSPIFCLDGDLAGKKAMSRVIDIYLEILDVGMNPRFLSILQAKDPDEYLKTLGVDKFLESLKTSKSISEVLLLESTYGQNINLPEVSMGILQNLKEKVSVIKNNHLRLKFIDFFKNSLNNYGKINDKRLYVNKKDLVVDNLKLKSQNNAILLICIILYPSLLNEVEEEIGTCSFANNNLETLREFLLDNSAIISENNLDDLLLDKNLTNVVEDILNMPLVKPIVDNIKSYDDAKTQFYYAYNLVVVDFLKQENHKILDDMKNLSNDNLNNDEKNKKFYKLQEKQKVIVAEIQNITKQLQKNN